MIYVYSERKRNRAETEKSMSSSPDSISLKLTDDGRIFIDNRQTEISEIGTIAKKAAENGSKEAVIETQSTTQTELPVRIVDEIKLAGIDKVVIASRK